MDNFRDRRGDTVLTRPQKSEWTRLPLATKRGYLRGVIARQAAVAERQVAAAAAAKRVSEGRFVAEDWSNGPYPVLRYANTLARTLGRLASGGGPMVDPASVRTRANGQVVVRVFPETVTDRCLYPGVRGEVWMRPGEVSRADSRGDGRGRVPRRRSTRAGLRRARRRERRLNPGPRRPHQALRRGTGLHAEAQSRERLPGPVHRGRALGVHPRRLSSDIVRGGAETGEYLCTHPDIDEIHITGSHRTHDAIVWGPGEEGERRRLAGTPRLSKRVTSELGNVSPMIVLPGPWSPADVRFQAENIATQMVNNCGFNCCAAKVLILPRQWPQAAALMQQLRAVLADIPQRFAYYPGAEERYDRFVSAQRNVRRGGRAAGRRAAVDA